MWLAITQIEAQDMLNKMFISDWPNQKIEFRKKHHKDLFNKAFPKEDKLKTVITQEDLNRALGLSNGR